MLDNTEPIRILLVDDEPTVRMLLRRWILRTLKAQVTEAENGLQGLEKIGSEKIDLVILDLNMPVLDGIEMLSLIRADPAQASLEVIIASTVGLEAKIKEVIALGVGDYLLKPLQQELVINRLQRAVDRLQKRRQPPGEVGTRVLVADPDPNFCEFARTALSGRFAVQAVRTAGEILVKMLRFKPDVILFHPRVLGARPEFLLSKIQGLCEARPVRLVALTDSGSQAPDWKEVTGSLPRSFVPEAFLSALVAELGEGPAPALGELSWVGSLESEIDTALRQALGMMTGLEPEEATEAKSTDTQPDFDLFGRIKLTAETDGFALELDLQCRREFAKSLVVTMLGGDESDIDEEGESSGLQEILNVVAGRIKNSCSERRIEVQLGLPDVSRELSPPPKRALWQKRMDYTWQGHSFHLIFYASALLKVDEAVAKEEAPPVASEEAFFGDLYAAAPEAPADTPPAKPPNTEQTDPKPAEETATAEEYNPKKESLAGAPHNPSEEPNEDPPP